MPYVDLIPGLTISPVPHALLDATHHLRWANPAWTQLCARPAESGASWFDQVDDTGLRDELPHIANMQAGTINAYECPSRLRAVDGKTIPVRLQVVQIEPDVVLVTALLTGSPADLEHSPSSVAGVTTHASTPAARSWTTLEDQALIAALSHDFRQHLRLVTSYLSLAQRQGSATLEPKILGHLHTAQVHAVRLQGLITDLVRWLRMNNDLLTLGPCSVAALWQDAQHQETTLLDSLHAQITQDEDLPTITGDPKLLAEALTHILRNALQYHGPGVPHIHLAAQREETGWCLSIRDDGPGMSAAECTRASGLFQRLHAWEQIPGNGMGLPLAQRILARHHGSVTLIPIDAGLGCTVQVRLPA